MLPSMPRSSQSCLFLSGFPTKTPYTFLFSPTHATCPVHLILLDLISWIFGEYSSWSFPLCHFLKSPVIAWLLHPVSSSATYSWTSSTHILHLWWGQVSEYNTILLWHDKRVTDGTFSDWLCSTLRLSTSPSFSSHSPHCLELRPASTSSSINILLNSTFTQNSKLHSGKQGLNDRHLIVVGKISLHILFWPWALPMTCKFSLCWFLCVACSMNARQWTWA
jgi:hypothetical protein